MRTRTIFTCLVAFSMPGCDHDSKKQEKLRPGNYLWMHSDHSCSMHVVGPNTTVRTVATPCSEEIATTQTMVLVAEQCGPVICTSEQASHQAEMRCTFTSAETQCVIPIPARNEPWVFQKD